MKSKDFVKLLCILFIALNTTAVQATITTYFPETDIADGNGIYGSAMAEVTSGITSGAGYLDILLWNTSPLGPEISPDGRANPFIMEIEFKYIDDFTLNESASYVSSLSDTLFAQGKDNEAVHFAERYSYYDLVAPDSPAMDKCFMTQNAGGEVDNIINDNTIGSASVLDDSNVPQEGWAEGFLNTQPDVFSGTVFDAALFHFAYNEDALPDPSFYSNPNTLIVKFVGGGDYSLHVSNVPEPASILLISLGGLVLLRRR
jgi:hypothetical protein